MTLIEALEAKRGDLSISVFAKQLGMDQSHYWRILHGERQIGAQMLKAILATFPDLRDVVMGELEGSTPDA